MRNITTLSIGEVEAAVAVGTLRRKECIRTNTQDTVASGKHLGNTFWEEDVDGAGAELTLCKFKNIYWNCSVNTYKQADVLENGEIRHTPLETGCLIVRTRDILDRFFILIIGQIPNYRIAGYLKGSDAIQPKWLRNPHNKEPAYFIPQSDLKDINNLLHDRIKFFEYDISNKKHQLIKTVHEITI